MDKLTKIPDAAFTELLNSLTPHTAAEPTTVHTDLRAYVALAASFDAAELEGIAPPDDVEDFLFEDCERVYTRSGTRWSLRVDVRQSTLAELDRQGRLQTLQGIGDATDITATMVRRYIRGDAPALTQQNVAELQGTATAAEWLARTSIEPPPPTEAKAQQLIEGMLQPLRALVADGVFGRSRQLDALREYVGDRGRVPLVIWGPGGVGKSTLVARFVLDRVDGGERDRFPFAYLSFDRSDLRVDQPLTLLAEAATQLAALHPEVAEDATALAMSARTAVASARASAEGYRASKTSAPVSRAYGDRDASVLQQRFAALLERASGRRDAPVVWVLDTFEVAQRQSRAAVGELWVFLDRLQDECPGLRIVLCGRVPLEGSPSIDLPLGDLDAEAARELLRTQLSGLGLPDDFLASVAGAVPPHPLSLRLAVLLIRREAQVGLASADRRRDVLFELRRGSVQGVLYRRILDHIEDPDVRKLANPGLVVRRITPEIIEKVLARPCGLGEVDPLRAAELFDKLRGEVAVVTPAGASTLVQHVELRRLMLPILLADDPEVVVKLQRAAIAYYRERTALQDKVEELYYRFSLGQSTATLDKAFDEDAARALMGDIEEFPASSQVYLANRIGVTVRPDILAEADDLSWARQTVLSSRRALDSGDAATALDLVQSRRNDTVYPQTAAIEVEALASLHRFDEALAAAHQAMQWATGHSDSDMFIDVALLAARIAEDTNDTEGALHLLEQVDSAASAADERISGWVARTAIVRVLRRAGREDSDRAQTMRGWLVDHVDELTARDRARNRALVRDLAAEIGDDVPSIAKDAVRFAGLSPVTQPESPPGRPDDPDDPFAWPPPDMTGSEVGALLNEAMDTDDEIRRRISDQLRYESDESAF